VTAKQGSDRFTHQELNLKLREPEDRRNTKVRLQDELRDLPILSGLVWAMIRRLPDHQLGRALIDAIFGSKNIQDGEPGWLTFDLNRNELAKFRQRWSQSGHRTWRENWDIERCESEINDASFFLDSEAQWDARLKRLAAGKRPSKRLRTIDRFRLLQVPARFAAPNAINYFVVRHFFAQRRRSATRGLRASRFFG
jgi:hypothetical protein